MPRLKVLFLIRRVRDEIRRFVETLPEALMVGPAEKKTTAAPGAEPRQGGDDRRVPVRVAAVPAEPTN